MRNAEFCAVCRRESAAVPMSTGRRRPIYTCLRGLACAMCDEGRKKGEDLAAYNTYHRAKFHRPKLTNARYVRYHVTKVLRTKKKTVNDISTTCLLACVDNKERHSKLSILLYAMYGGIKTFTNSECL